jgi:hypothetical protein
MVKRSYSRLFYCLPIALCLFLIPDEIALIRALADLGRGCDSGYCHQLSDLQMQTAVAETVAAALALLKWLSRWRESARKNQRRQAAARGDGSHIPLAKIVLGDVPPPLDLPVTIRLKMAWRDWLLAMGGTALIIQCAFVAALVAYHPEPGQYPAVIVALLCEAGLLLFLALLSAVVALGVRERLVVTPDGLRARWFGLPQFVRWEDARLFAQVDDTKFELSSPTAIVRFTRLDRVRGLRPAIPFDDYRRQTDALLLLIAERTGLPLHDLRDEK